MYYENHAKWKMEIDEKIRGHPNGKFMVEIGAYIDRYILECMEKETTYDEIKCLLKLRPEFSFLDDKYCKMVIDNWSDGGLIRNTDNGFVVLGSGFCDPKYF